jgi:RNA polymerase sigma-70 factor (ECF subfamily)
MADLGCVERAMHGDHDAFAALAQSELPRLDAIARLITRDREAAQDAVQEALVRAWRDLPALRDLERFDAWMSRLLVRACYDEIRRRRRRSTAESMVTTAVDPAIDREIGSAADRDTLERAFRRIGPEHRAVIVLHLYVGHSVPEVAAMLSIPAGTVKSRLHRGLRELRAAIEADDRAAAGLHEVTER